jgi:hypothetical protein
MHCSVPGAGRQIRNLPNVNILRFARFEVLMVANMENELEDGGSTFLQNIGKLVPNYIVSHPRR